MLISNKTGNSKKHGTQTCKTAKEVATCLNNGGTQFKLCSEYYIP